MTTTYKISKEELLRLLKPLPADTGIKLRQNTYDGLLASQSDKHHLLASKYDGSTGVIQTPANIDFRKDNAYKRKVLTLGPQQKHSIQSINESLSNDKNIMESLFGIVVGVVSTGGGALFSIAKYVLSPVSVPVRARLGDEVWQLETYGKVGTSVKYVNYLILLDPFRAKGPPNTTHEWVIHEDRWDYFTL
jgi:hypothetical protein